jgi:hypothetical protein
VVGLLPYVLLVMLPTLAISLWAAWRVRSTYARWDKVDSGISMSALDFARYLLNQQGLNDVRVEQTPGRLTDHYDPRQRVLRVSNSVARAGRTAAPRPAAAGSAASNPWVGSGDYAAAPVRPSLPSRSSPTRSAMPSRTARATPPCACAR